MSNSSFAIFKRMMVFLKPYFLLYITASLLIAIVSLVDSVAVWFLSTLPQILFSPDSFSMESPELTFSNINEILKYYSYTFISSDGNPLSKICFFIIIAFILKNLILYLSKAISHHVNLSISQNMRSTVYRHIMNLPVSYFDNNKTGAIITNITSDLGMMNLAVTSTIQTLTMQPIKLMINISILLMINWKLTLMVFVIYPILGFLIVVIGKSVKRRYKREIEAMQNMLSMLSETLNGIRAIKMFNTHDSEYENYVSLNEKHKKLSMVSNLTKETISPITELLGIIVTVGLLWFAGNSILTGGSEFTADDFFRFIFFLIASYQPLKAIGGINNTIQMGLTAAQRVFNLLDVEEEELHAVGSKDAPVFNKQIQFSNVHFTYPGFSNKIINNLSFTVDKGSTVAIVGSSGAGKSTILDLLPRFYEINSGEISIDNISTKEVDIVALRSLFGIVSQDTFLFNISVKENITYGISCTDDEIYNAVKSANALGFIENLSNGFDTIIGERGVTLSGGQRQRIAIARALLRNPEILILDEATSALDTESEKLVQRAIDNVTENRTSFIVAHRLSTVLHADKIIVIEDGQIVEEGSHSELLEINNRYKYFYDIQFKNNKE